MTLTPPSSRTSENPASPDAQHRVTRKRNRIPLSCGPCRHRKLKCNRSQPCDNCIKRGDHTSCAYASASSKRRPAAASGEIGTPDEMQNRIDRLEGLVLSLMTNGSEAVGQQAARAALGRGRPSIGESLSEEGTGSGSAEVQKDNSGYRDDDSEVEGVSRSIGVMKVQHDRQFYASEAHWWAILSDIAEVKRYFAEHSKQYEEQMEKISASKASEGSQAATSLLFKGTQKIDREKILSQFPPRSVADTLILRYFSTENPSFRILHNPTFRQEYERHWQNPSSTSIVWIGMVFAMMSMALNSYHRAADEPPEYRGSSLKMSEEYAEHTAQCLVAADFTQPVNFMVEALVLYALAEQTRRRDVETGLWMLAGMITRLAMRMGMHRDSEPYASISPFLGEMRRRCWSIIRMMDINLSFQCGLPGMLHSSITDTRLPTNIYDEEFGPDSSSLPPSRPTSENTPVSFMISHTRLTYVLGRIQELNVSLTLPPYEDTMKLDAELREAYNQIPEHLRLHCRDGSSLDAAGLVMQRFTLDLAYHKSQCVLHRKFLARARKESRFAYSRRVCLEACLQMLEHQSTLARESGAGGRLRSVTWGIATSLTTHDFLLAAMIICLDLYYTAQAEAEGRTGDEMYHWATERRESMFAAIGEAVRIWESLRDSSMEAYKASSIVKVMIEKLRNHEVLRQQMSQNFSFAKVRSNGVGIDGQVAPEHSAAMTLGMMSSGLTPDAMGMYGGGQQGQPQNGQGQQQQQQMPRTGLTPQPMNGTSGDLNQMPGMLSPNAGMNGGGNTPFSNMFGAGLGSFDMLDNMPATNLDWGDWDTYVHGPGRGDFGMGTNLFDTPSFQDSAGIESQQTTSGTQPPAGQGQMSQGSPQPPPNAFQGTNGNGFSNSPKMMDQGLAAQNQNQNQSQKGSRVPVWGAASMAGVGGVGLGWAGAGRDGGGGYGG